MKHFVVQLLGQSSMSLCVSYRKGMVGEKNEHLSFLNSDIFAQIFYSLISRSSEYG